MFRGLNNVGIGVSDMDKALEFYGSLFGFIEVMFDYTGSLPGMENVTGKPETKARVVMLRNPHGGPAGLGMIKLVYLLPPNKAEPCTVADTSTFGDIGFGEICFNMRGDIRKAFNDLLGKGVKAIGVPESDFFPPHDALAHYALMRDLSDNTLIELVVWEQCRTFGDGLRVEGVNHVSFGVSNIEISERFYRELGFEEEIFDSAGPLEVLLPNGEEIRVKMLANYYGAWIEPIQLLPPAKPTPFRKAWGHLGSMEIAIEVTNLDKAYEELKNKGIEFRSAPQTLDVSSGQWKYAYVVEPDNLYVSLIEPKY